MRTLKQIKDYISTAQNDLAIFERKRALLRKAHVALCSYCWYDGMEIDHDSVPTENFPKESIDNEVKATTIALELTHRAIYAMEKLQSIIPDDYEEMFADKEYELKDTNQNLLENFKKIRALFPAAAAKCVLWEGLSIKEEVLLQLSLAKSDDAIIQQDATTLRQILTNIFQQQAQLIKKQIEERLPPLKNEYDELKKDLQSVNSDEIVKKCGKPYWAEVSGTEEWFVKNHAFPIPNLCASDFVSQPITELDTDMFHYKRIYDNPEAPSSMRIFGFDSREQFEKILAKYNAQSKEEYEVYWAMQAKCFLEHDDVSWAKSAVIRIDDNFYYYAANELFPQWEQILSQALPILENEPDDNESNNEWCRERCKQLLQLPVVELKPAPCKESRICRKSESL